MTEPARVICGDMRAVLATLPAESVHAIVTDPPYGLAFMGKAWDQQVPGPEYWRECLRVAKPGAHLIAFGGTRTAHRLACAIEDAGWEIRDCLSWLYGSGFPKSHDISKAIDRELGAVRETVRVPTKPGNKPGQAGPIALGASGKRAVSEAATDAARAWDGWGTALKPAWEPIYIARKPFRGSVAGCVCEHRCGALNVDGCRIGFASATDRASAMPVSMPRANASIGTFAMGDRSMRKPADEQSPLGRWPANLVLDEAAAAMLDAEVGELTSGKPIGTRHAQRMFGAENGTPISGYGDSGGPSRFFYTAKASRSEREAGLSDRAQRNVNDGRDTPIDNPYQRGDTQRRNVHPTVKPVSLMRWLVRLITPRDGTVLDPFTGSGTTGVAAVLEGARFIGCELSPEYAELARSRIAHAADEDDGPQLTLFERAEIKTPPRPTQAAFLWTDDEGDMKP